MSIKDKLSSIVSRKQSLENTLASSQPLSSDEFIAFSKELAELTPVANVAYNLQQLEKEKTELNLMIKDPSTDLEMLAMAREELISIQTQIQEQEQNLRVLLLPKDAADEKNAIIEIRAGTGGEEAALFASNLLRMYQRYCEIRKWRFELLSANETGIGGMKEVTALISGKGAFRRLKYESGVHRVQRVPETEASGRIHTSAATVAVLPEAEEVDIEIADKDLRIDVFRSSGPGGQSVNTTDSAVRITHLPTGLVVQQQDEKSQHKNKAKALKVLRSRLYDLERAQAQAERSESRKAQIGSGDRSERIRTYNYPQGRVSDHRINLTLYKLEEILNGEALDEVIDALIADDQATQLSHMS